MFFKKWVKAKYSCLPKVCKFLVQRILGKIKLNQEKKRNLSRIPAIWAFYDLSVNAPGYDIVRFLILAEIQRIKLNIDSIYVVIIPSRNEFDDWYRSYSNQSDNFLRWRVRQIVIPCCYLLPSVKQIYSCASRGEANIIQKNAKSVIFPYEYSIKKPIALTENLYLRDIKDEIRFNPTISPSEISVRFIQEWIRKNCDGKKLITITLRESTCDPIRNSNLSEWKMFIDSLDEKIYFPLVLRDTEKSFTPELEILEGCNFFSDPCFNVELRAALYDQSYLNMTVQNGPILLMMCNKSARFLLFILHKEDSPVANMSAFESIGLTPGKQLPYLTAYQKIVWEDDQYEIIQREFNAMVGKIESGSNG